MKTATLKNTRDESGAGALSLGINDKIDLCRGLFACLVVSAHARELAWSMYRSPDPTGGIARFIHYALGTGIYWVMGFFVISGYCIQLSVDRMTADGEFRVNDYLLARLTRILPLYYLALLFAATVEAFIGPCRPACWTDGINLQTLAYQILVVQGCTQTLGCFGPSWSITSELFYYLLFALLVWAAPRSRNIPTIAGLLVCLVVGASLQILHAVGPKYPIVPKIGMLFGLGVNWFLGAMVARHRNVLSHYRPFTLASRCWPVLLIGSMAVLSTELVRPGLVFILAGIAFTLMLVDFLGRDARRATPPATSPSLRWAAQTIGLASYPMYLFHGPLMLILGALSIHWRFAESHDRIWGLATLASLACGLLLGVLAERPIMVWRAGLLTRWRRGPRSWAASTDASSGSKLLGASQ